MKIIQEIKSISSYDASIAIITFASVVAPGLLLIYEFNRPLITTLTTPKLILLSLSITLPVMFLNFVLYGMQRKSKRIVISSDNIAAAGILSFATLCPSLAVVHIFSLSFNWFVGLVILLEIISLGLDIGPNTCKKAKDVDISEAGPSNQNKQSE